MNRVGAVPMVLARFEEDTIAGPDDLDRSLATLGQADALGDEDGLPIGVRVPGGSRAGREVHAARAQPRAMRWRRNCVDVDNAGEPLGRAGGGLDAALCDVHVVLLSNPAFEPSAGLGSETAVL